MPNTVSTRIRMHRMQELGECFLLSFTANARRSHLLIDCGTFQNGGPSKARLGQVVKSIKDALNGKPLNAVVGTHQHNDHMNGFLHCAPEFERIGIEQVWLSWLDDPADGLAQGIGDQYNNLRANVIAAVGHLRDSGPNGRSLTALNAVEDLLGFVGAVKTKDKPAVIPEKARKVLQGIGRKPPTYLRPGMSVDMPGLPAGTVRLHVLGPPRNQDALERKNPRKGESYDKHLARVSASSRRFLDALGYHAFRQAPRTANKGGAPARPPSELREEHEYPFGCSNKRFEGDAKLTAGMKAMIADYRHKDQAWRNIDNDWLEQAAAMALWMDDFTNNTSLVLAIELVASEKVLLFAADAQTGNWTSWKDVKWKDEKVRTDDLLKRTVFYKVGHHGSHNSTHKEVFDTMDNPHMVAMIPVDKTDPSITKKKNPWKMPAHELFAAIKSHTANRVLQMDGVDDPDCDTTKPAVKAAWKKAGVKVDTSSPLYVEITI